MLRATADVVTFFELQGWVTRYKKLPEKGEELTWGRISLKQIHVFFWGCAAWVHDFSDNQCRNLHDYMTICWVWLLPSNIGK